MFRLEHLIDFNHLTNFKRHPKLKEHMHIHWMIQQIFAYGYALLFRAYRLVLIHFKLCKFEEVLQNFHNSKEPEIPGQ